MCVSLLKHLLLHKYTTELEEAGKTVPKLALKADTKKKKKVASCCKAYMGGTGRRSFSFLVLC